MIKLKEMINIKYAVFIFLFILNFCENSYSQINAFMNNLMVYSEDGKNIKVSNKSNDVIVYAFEYRFTYYDKDFQKKQMEQGFFGYINPRINGQLILTIPQIREDDPIKIEKIEIVNVTRIPYANY